MTLQLYPHLSFPSLWPERTTTLQSLPVQDSRSPQTRKNEIVWTSHFLTWRHFFSLLVPSWRHFRSLILSPVSYPDLKITIPFRNHPSSWGRGDVPLEISTGLRDDLSLTFVIGGANQLLNVQNLTRHCIHWYVIQKSLFLSPTKLCTEHSWVLLTLRFQHIQLWPLPPLAAVAPYSGVFICTGICPFTQLTLQFSSPWATCNRRHSPEIHEYFPLSQWCSTNIVFTSYQLFFCQQK